MEKKGYKVGIVKPEDFSSYETYDNYITKQSKKDVRIVPLHFDASRSGGTGFLTRTRSGDADGIEKGTPLSTTQSSAKKSSWQDRLRNRRSRSTASTVESEIKPIQIPKPIQSKLSSSTAKISESAEYEMGFDSKSPVVVMQSQKRTTPSSVNSGGGQMIPISISKKETLNSYYKSQIIGFLYKQG